MNEILTLTRQILEDGSLIRLVLGNKRKKSVPYGKVVIRPFAGRDGVLYQAEYVYENKVLHENLDPEELLEQIAFLMENSFKQANFFTADADYQVLAAKPAKPRIIRKDPTMERQGLSHNQIKKYVIPDGEPVDFLVRLGVMNESGKVHAKYYGKFRQINRFLEITRDVLDALPEARTIRIIDFGCGKAYLTFGLYYYLKKQLGRDVQIIGLDLKEDVIRFCSNVAEDLGYEGLQFQIGDIAEYQGTEADMVVTLHACDTATDYALLNAKKWGASVILSVPCCQHELFRQLKNPLHEPMLRQGILKDRFCAILTDTFRQLKLEEWGYDVSMIEFTSLEHTAKNIMIRAVRTGKPKEKAPEQIRELKEYWHVDPTIVREDI